VSLADDRGAVVHLLHRYAHAVDDANAAGVAGCFTRDGRFGTRDSTVAVQGRDGLLAFFREVLRYRDRVVRSDAEGWLLAAREHDLRWQGEMRATGPGFAIRD
jgi:hypothetical protein